MQVVIEEIRLLVQQPYYKVDVDWKERRGAIGTDLYRHLLPTFRSR